VGPRAGLDDVEKRKFLTLPGIELRRLGRPARNQSLDEMGVASSTHCREALTNIEVLRERVE
jgi:hypothetical protein